MTTAVAGKEISMRHGNVPIGVEIIGVDLAKDLDQETFNKIRDAYYRHSVIVFRAQKLTSRQQVSFSRRFSSRTGAS